MTKFHDPSEYLKELERRQDQVLQELDVLNHRIESVLESYSGKRGEREASGIGLKAAT